MKFDFIIGNPPYQEDTENSVRKNPIYNLFMDESYKIADVVELITPGRFLFDAGQTPSAWNKKMLEDTHFRVLHYEKNASKIFPNTDIKGGVVVSIYDATKENAPIGVFTPYEELNTIYRKIQKANKDNAYMDSIVSSRGMYRLTKEFFVDFPDASEKVGNGTGNMIVSNIFDKIPEAFYDELNSEECIKILGRTRNKRVYKYILSKYVINNEYIDKYKVLFPEANGSGKFGECLSESELGCPGEGGTDTFLNIGMFDDSLEAENLIKYIKTKFFRALLGIKKATQHTPKSVWSTIPMQEFSSKSNIDWSKSISEIDQQLYKKYKLSDEEIEFIEKNVKEME